MADRPTDAEYAELARIFGAADTPAFRHSYNEQSDFAATVRAGAASSPTDSAIQAIRDRLAPNHAERPPVDDTDTRPQWHDVRVHWSDGRTHLDGIRGHDREHALDTAQWNWISANPYGRADRIEYLGVSDDQGDPADEYTPTDWWGDDYPDTDGDRA